MSVVVRRYFAKLGFARVSLRYLENAIGSSRTNLVDSLRRIVDHGAIKVRRQGSGTRPTEYDLNFEFGSEIATGDTEVTASTKIVSGDLGVTASVTPASPQAILSGHMPVTQTHLQDQSIDWSIVDGPDTPVPMAPPLAGLSPASADPGVGSKKTKNPFDELWAVYPRQHKPAEARAAYKALAPDQRLHAELMAAATALKIHYEKNPTETRFRKHLHSWIEKEGYKEEMPIVYSDKPHNKPDTPRKAAASKIAAPPFGRHEVEIIKLDILGDPLGSTDLCARFRIRNGKHTAREFEHQISYNTPQGVSDDGSELFASLSKATGIRDPEDTSDFLGKVVVAVVGRNGGVTCHAP
jgi:hypothetical protein